MNALRSSIVPLRCHVTPGRTEETEYSTGSMASKQPMHILALPLYPGEFSSRIRVDFFLPYLQEEGLEINVYPPLPRETFERNYGGGKSNRIRYHISELFHRTHSLSRAGAYDLVWVQKGLTLFPWRGLELIRGLFSSRLVLDVDDAVIEFPPIQPRGSARLFADLGQIQKLRKKADLVLCGNQTLLQDLREEPGWAEWLPSTIPLSQYSHDRRNEEPSPTLVWIGTASNRKYLSEISSVLCSLAEEFAGLNLLVVSDSLEGLAQESFGKCGLELDRWDSSRESEQIGRGWIGLMPLSDDRWAERKGGYKILQYFACGMPVVASPVGINRDLVVEGKNGFLPRDQADWIEAIRVLLTDADRRRDFGNAGRNRIRASYSTERWAKHLASWFRRLGPRHRP